MVCLTIPWKYRRQEKRWVAINRLIQEIMSQRIELHAWRRGPVIGQLEHGDTWLELLRQAYPDLEIKHRCDLLGEEHTDALAGDTTDDFSAQPAVGEGVIAVVCPG